MGRGRFVTAAVAVVAAYAGFAQANPCGFPQSSHPIGWSAEQFYRQFPHPGPQRELAVVDQVLSGNVPARMAEFVPVSFAVEVQGQPVTFQLGVAPDYLIIGSDQDFVRAPLTNYAAQYLASELGFVLPTPFLVDRIYEAASVKLLPQPTDWYKHDEEMRLGPNYFLFNETIEQQRQGRSGLIAGHKKDVVLTNLLDQHPDRVAIYGWQQPGNRPIQPVAVPHGFEYEDYSHGIRFLDRFVTVTVGRYGRPVTLPLADALKDRQLGSILNGGLGPINDVRAARMCTPEFLAATGLAAQACPPQPRSCAP